MKNRAMVAPQNAPVQGVPPGGKNRGMPPPQMPPQGMAPPQRQMPMPMGRQMAMPVQRDPRALQAMMQAQQLRGMA